jgi:hypothetical protein
MNASGRSTVGGSSGLRSQVEKLGLVIRDHDLQLEQDRRAVAALEDDKVRCCGTCDFCFFFLPESLTNILHSYRSV